jgi:hypothetical protein
MRWSSRRDGCTAVFDDAPAYEPGGGEVLIIEPTIEAFTPNGWCHCGGSLGFRCATDGTHEVVCLRCHEVCLRLSLSTKVHG